MADVVRRNCSIENQAQKALLKISLHANNALIY